MSEQEGSKIKKVVVSSAMVAAMIFVSHMIVYLLPNRDEVIEVVYQYGYALSCVVAAIRITDWALSEEEGEGDNHG